MLKQLKKSATEWKSHPVTLPPLQVKEVGPDASGPAFLSLSTGAGDRNRTGTDIAIRRILSPLRLPVPPPRHDKL